MTSRELWVRVAAFSSGAAGLIHATAASAHAGHVGAMWVFAVVAVFQTGWGMVLLTAPGPAVRLIGMVGNLAVIGGWLLAVAYGIPQIQGLESPEGFSIPSTLAALLAAVAVAAAIHAAHPGTVLTAPRTRAIVTTTGLALTFAVTAGIATAATQPHTSHGTTTVHLSTHTH